MQTISQNPNFGGISPIHRHHHERTIALARTVRHDGARHARLLQLAKDCRFYFEQFRKLGA